MLMTKYRRKAILVEHNVSMKDVAADEGVDIATVSRVVAGTARRDTDKVQRIKQNIARRIGVAVADLWPASPAAAAEESALVRSA